MEMVFDQEIGRFCLDKRNWGVLNDAIIRWPCALAPSAACVAFIKY